MAAIMDRGYSWVICTVVFCSYFCLMMGTAAFAVLYPVLLSHFSSTNAETAMIASLNNALGAISGLLLIPIVQRFGCRSVAMVGCLGGSVGYGACFFAQNIYHILIGYGILNGLANGLIFFSSTVVLHQYFDKRRTMATAISSCGVSIAILVCPPITRWLINSLGWRTSMLVLSATYLHNSIGAVLMRPQILSSYKATEVEEDAAEVDSSTGCWRSFSQGVLEMAKSVWTSLDISIFRNPRLSIFLAGTCLMTFGYLVPVVFIPTYAISSLGLSPTQGASMLSIVAGCTIAGRIVSGIIGDTVPFFKRPGKRVYLYSVPLILCGLATASIYMIHNGISLIVYCAVAGFLTGTFVVAQQPVMVDLFGVENISKVLAFLLICNGLSAFVCQPISGWLVDISGTFTLALCVAGIIQAVGGFLLLSLVLLGPTKRKINSFSHKEIENGSVKSNILKEDEETDTTVRAQSTKN